MAQPFSGLWSGNRSCRRRCCVQEQHDLADHPMVGLAHDNPLGTLGASPMDIAQPAQLLLDSINPCILRLHDLNLCGRGREIRRRCHVFKADQAALQRRQEEFECHAVAAPSASWSEAAFKARYLIELFATTPEARYPRRGGLIAKVLGDFARLSRLSGSRDSVEQ
jgi:hypothetical protein